MFLIPEEYWSVAKTLYKGKGVFALKQIQTGTIIGDYLGTIVDNAEYDLKKDKKGLYLMFYNDRYSVYPDLRKPGIHLLNHSCEPNCWIYSYKGRTLFFALRTIEPGEELTISYLLSPKDDTCKPCTHDCICGSTVCSGTMHLPKDKFKKWQTFLNKEMKKTKKPSVASGDRLLPLKKYPAIDLAHPIYTSVHSHIIIG